MSAKTLIGSELKIVGNATQSITDATTTSFDFGTPGDLYLPVNANGASYASGDRLFVVFRTSRAAGTTSIATLVVQDADDNAGSIGTPATAVTDGILAHPVADTCTIHGIRLQANRPWLRLRITLDDATDTVVCSVLVVAIPGGL